MKVRKSRVAVLVAFLTMAVAIPLAGVALAGPAQVVGNITGDPVAPGVQATLSFTISPTGKTLASFTLTPPTNWQLVSGTQSQGSVTGNQLVVTGLSVSPATSTTVTFDVKTGCKSGNWDWTLAALDSQGRTFGNDASDLTTNVNGNCSLAITTQPRDAVKGKLITGSAFDDSTSPVTVELRNGSDQVVTYFPVDVSFDLATGSGLASGSLSAATKTTVNGVATFSGPASTLSIGTSNEPQFTDYKLKPKTVGTYAGLGGANSDGFDIWDAACSGNGCSAALRSGRDEYKTTTNTVLSASTLPSGAVAISCPGQRLIFQDDVFVHETSSPDPVFVTSHITAQDFRAAGTNFGQANVEWCVGLKPGDPGLSNGGTYTPVDLNGDTVTDYFVGFAPRCPSKSPELSAPCIVSQMSDGNKGSITTGYLQGGDPPRRT
jgi:hypothetical protein